MTNKGLLRERILREGLGRQNNHTSEQRIVNSNENVCSKRL